MHSPFKAVWKLTCQRQGRAGELGAQSTVGEIRFQVTGSKQMAGAVGFFSPLFSPLFQSTQVVAPRQRSGETEEGRGMSINPHH